MQNVEDGYNKTKQRTLNYLAPIEVNENKEAVVWDHMYNDRAVKKHVKKLDKRSSQTRYVFTFRINDYVRLSCVRYTLQRDYQQKWTTEIFKVSNRYLKENIPQYNVVDLLDSEVIGSFYEWEILRVSNNFQFWRIESILKTRERKGKEEYLIKWEGYPDKFNSWTLASDIKDLKS